MAGVNVPLLAAEHFYVVTDASPDIPRNLPVLRVPDECAYVKEEAGKLLVGFFEPKGKPLPDAKPSPTTASFSPCPTTGTISPASWSLPPSACRS